MKLWQACSEKRWFNFNRYGEMNMISNNNQKFGFRDNILWITVLTLLLLLASDFLSLFHINLAVFSKEYAATFNMYLSFWAMWVVFVVAIVGISKNRYILDKLKHGNGGNTFNNLMIGFAAGFLMNGACALSAYLHGDIKLSFYRFEPVPVLFMFIAVFIQSHSLDQLTVNCPLFQHASTALNEEPGRPDSNRHTPQANTSWKAVIHGL